MFDKSADTKWIDVLVTLTDGRKLHGMLECGITISISKELDNDSRFIELHDSSRNPVFIGKSQIATLEPCKDGKQAMPEMQLSALKNSNWNRVLGVPSNATPEEVKQAYHAKAKQYHPDVFSACLPDEMRRYASDMFARINQAYEEFKALKIAA